MLGSGRFLYKQVDSIPKVFNARPKVRDSRDEVRKKIIIPRRIKRGPTDILRALSSTVSLDPTAFDYRYPDDPYFYTYNKADKRVYALSMESGRKAAKWVIKENPGFFKHQLADPPIEAFLQKVDSTEETEESLLTAIEERNVLNAIKIYEALKAKNQDVESSTKQSLLELVCFYNAQEKPDMELDSKWFEGFLGKVTNYKEIETEWKKDNFPELLFQEMDQSCPLAISAIIQGRFKYKKIESAVELYNSARQKNIKLSVGVYNSLLSEAPAIVKERDKISDFLMEKLAEMSKENIRPNLGTLNAALKALTRTAESTTARKLVCEFRALGIHPSLGSYRYLLEIFSNSRSARKESAARPLAWDILVKIGNRELNIMHPSDLEFFPIAMTLFSENYKDCGLALRLHKIFLRPGNAKFITKARDEFAYFKQFFFLLFQYKSIDFSMSIYRQYVFTRFCPNLRVMTAICEAVHENLLPQYLVELWEDIKLLGFSKNRLLLTNILSMIPDFTDEASLKVFHEAAISFLSKLNDFKPGDEGAFPSILLALSKNNDEEEILKTIQFAQKKKLLFLELPESTAEAIVDLAVSKKNVPLILETLRFAIRQDLASTGELAKKCLPLLSGDNEDWAKTVISEYETSRKKTKAEEKNVTEAEEKDV